MCYYHKICIGLRSYIKGSKEFSSELKSHGSHFKKSRLRLVFGTHFSVFGNQMKHSSSYLIYRSMLINLISKWEKTGWSSDFEQTLSRQYFLNINWITLTGYQRLIKDFVWLFKFDRKLNSNILSETYKNKNKVWKSSTGVFVFVCAFSWLLGASESCFEWFCLSATGTHAALYYVNKKVGKLEVQFDTSSKEI